ncbi:hypothetical protein ACOSQ2_025711 [Xanthoceras sorbifolium]
MEKNKSVDGDKRNGEGGSSLMRRWFVVDEMVVHRSITASCSSTTTPASPLRAKITPSPRASHLPLWVSLGLIGGSLDGWRCVVVGKNKEAAQMILFGDEEEEVKIQKQLSRRW